MSGRRLGVLIALVGAFYAAAVACGGTAEQEAQDRVETIAAQQGSDPEELSAIDRCVLLNTDDLVDAYPPEVLELFDGEVEVMLAEACTRAAEAGQLDESGLASVDDVLAVELCANFYARVYDSDTQLGEIEREIVDRATFIEHGRRVCAEATRLGILDDDEALKELQREIAAELGFEYPEGGKQTVRDQSSAFKLQDHMDALAEIDRQVDQLPIDNLAASLEINRLTGEYRALDNQVGGDEPSETDSPDLLTAWQAFTEVLKLRIEAQELLAEALEQGGSFEGMSARLDDLSEEHAGQVGILNGALDRYSAAFDDG